ncbi:MAG: SGNH/GDSL hydrolase family protein [Bacteroidota bacterium]
MSTHINSFLCLGDSYTIGESVPLHEGFPYQTTQLLRSAGLHFHAPEIVAQTGWTSFELADHLINWKLNSTYDYVSLLIGVNNQYRGLAITDFANDFEFLVKKAIHFTNNKADHVVVLSIPDWTATAFAKQQNKNVLSKEIDAYNEICKTISAKFHVQYIDITTDSRLAKTDTSLLAIDHLHYSAKAYAIWAKKIFNILKK